MEPAVFVPTLGYIAILELETEKDPVVIARTVQQYRSAEANFLAARRIRLRQMPEGEGVDFGARPPRTGRGDAALANTQYIPLVEKAGRKEAADQNEITRLLREITRQFQAVKQVTDRLLSDTGDGRLREAGRRCQRLILEQRQHHSQPPRGGPSGSYQVCRRPQYRPSHRHAERPCAQPPAPATSRPAFRSPRRTNSGNSRRASTA